MLHLLRQIFFFVKLKMVNPDKYYVFYDGECGFCNYWVSWILKRDHKDQFMFASLQGNFGQNFLWDRGLDRKQYNTLYLWKPESFYLVKSEAVLEIAKILGGSVGLLAKMNIFPRFFSDIIYDRIAANRQKLKADCTLPTAQQRKKFVE